MTGHRETSDSNTSPHQRETPHQGDLGAAQAKGASERPSHESQISAPGTSGFKHSDAKGNHPHQSSSVERDDKGHAHAIDFAKDDIYQKNHQPSKLDAKGDNAPHGGKGAHTHNPATDAGGDSVSGTGTGAGGDKHGARAKHPKTGDHDHDKDKHKDGHLAEKREERRDRIENMIATNNNFVGSLPQDLQQSARDSLRAAGPQGAAGTRSQFESIAAVQRATPPLDAAR